MHPDTIVEFILTADQFPDRAEVTKARGTAPYVLRQNLTVYTDQKGEKPTVIKGLFLVNERGDINQIAPSTKLATRMVASDVRDFFPNYWDDDRDMLTDTISVRMARALVALDADGQPPEISEVVDEATAFLRAVGRSVTSPIEDA